MFLTLHPPPATRHPPPVTRHPPPVTRYPSPFTRHPPPTEKSCCFIFNCLELFFAAFLGGRGFKLIMKNLGPVQMPNFSTAEPNTLN